ncbi:MAG: C/D box methylation guide ribonucleoprotein complex aNOP56 subunit [Candidatus Hydrothermarchaeales archaeon]
MKAYIAKSVLGIFAFDADGRLIDSIAFPKDPEMVAERLIESEDKLIAEEEELIKELKDYEIIIEKESYIKDLEVENPNLGGEVLRSNLEKFAIDFGFSEDEFKKFSHRVNIILTKRKIRVAHEEKDKLIIQAIEALDDVDESLNLLSERIREWYSIHFPEMDGLVEDHEKYVGMVRNFGSRDAFDKELSEIAKSSMGAELEERDISILKGFAGEIYNLYHFRSDLEGYLDSAMGDVAPNLKALVGASLGARLISIAGGLENIGKMPASRIQVLGAKKALFLHLKKKGGSPKHGIIFQHGMIGKSPWWQRGKIARALASKIAIAARLDAFSGKFLGDELREDFLKRAEKIKEEFSVAPKKMRIIKARKEKRGRGKKGRWKASKK